MMSSQRATAAAASPSALYVVSRLDITYGAPIAPRADWRGAVAVPWLPAEPSRGKAPDQVHVFGEAIVDVVLDVLARYDVVLTTYNTVEYDFRIAQAELQAQHAQRRARDRAVGAAVVREPRAGDEGRERRARPPVHARRRAARGDAG